MQEMKATYNVYWTGIVNRPGPHCLVLVVWIVKDFDTHSNENLCNAVQGNPSELYSMYSSEWINELFNIKAFNLEYY